MSWRCFNFHRAVPVTTPFCPSTYVSRSRPPLAISSIANQHYPTASTDPARRSIFFQSFKRKQPRRKMATNDGKMLWVDLEMSGLDLTKDVILEIACIATDAQLNQLDDGVCYQVKTDKQLLDNMGQWCREQHGKTGLTAACVQAKENMGDVEKRVLAYADKHFKEPKALLSGNSVHVDKQWLAKDMPGFHDRLHYRVCDVSSVKELVARWYPELADKMKRQREQVPEESDHRALSDIKWSINELKWYRANVFQQS